MVMAAISSFIWALAVYWKNINKTDVVFSASAFKMKGIIILGIIYGNDDDSTELEFWTENKTKWHPFPMAFSCS